MKARTAFVAAVIMSALALETDLTIAAEPFAEQQSVTVKYEDADLTTERGAAALTTRIAHAADVVCGPVDFRNLQDRGLFQVCREAAIRAAMDKVRTAAARHSLYAASGAKPMGTN